MSSAKKQELSWTIEVEERCVNDSLKLLNQYTRIKQYEQALRVNQDIERSLKRIQKLKDEAGYVDYLEGIVTKMEQDGIESDVTYSTKK
ncbi:hypothetical protein [Alkalibacillus almallahensis]|uniref:hypothetical protein n=1 Tax=Alkalibacillus almallahensis TaxID=1379154 RepID=UPI00141F2845|nr:hypothetical protein [Alkalibacillus almallahensis]NIK10880.1 hypothetical protein [Alkalibacillus almallahensis]